MASQVEIANMALRALGANPISSMTEATRNARAVNAIFGATRDAELEEHNWSFAIKRATIAADASAPDWGRATAFTLPSDFIRLAPPYPEDNYATMDLQIEDGKIITDETAPLYIRYIYRNTSYSEYPALFVKALAARLALDLCEEITQSNTKKEGLSSEYEKLIKRAKRSNAIQNVAQEAPDSSWITCRS